ncbi:MULTISPECIES: HK97-gp10 family putative phage morphogenesis protein [unclassified Roseovarius]|uniref:HK97-gp10 family putative phage morphogenesis protein n=1 Tax=unclassified Roseovarius TaxID=2614913 RepID=UPI00273E557D|nr:MULTISPECIES: HK97-gp10 family putative phage morphogenesis protein [unclassified Roseovarius]
MSITKDSKRLEKRLKAIPGDVLDGLRPALVKGAQDIADAMETLVPEDTGDLQNTITVTGPNDTTPAYAAGGGKRTAGPQQALVTVGSPEVRYGHIVEFGSVKTEAQPFMRPAFRLKKAKVMRRIQTAVNKVIKKAGKP